MVTHSLSEPGMVTRVEPWRIELLGSIRARRGRTLVNEFRTRRAAVLLARLALNARPHRRDELIGMLWPGAPASAGRQNLSQSLSELRRRLEVPHECDVLFATREMVWLDREHFRTDVEEFEEAMSAARLSINSERVRYLERAVAVANAPLLPGVDHDWAVASRERITAECDAALHELVSHYESAGQLSAAFEHAWRRVRIDPMDEEAHREFAHLFERAGRPAAALQHLLTLEQSLGEQFGARPDAETRAMLDSLRGRLRAMSDTGI
jgi:DNA-binding SARP family transcriptional activator